MNIPDFQNEPNSPLYFGGISLIQYFNSQGFEAYLVGGCVRDLLLGRVISDYDICTSALPDEVMSLFSDTIPTGIEYGTVTVVWGGFHYEVTTFRGDGTYSDGRRPDSVVFGVSLEEDLKRRDFTINGMAYHPSEGLIDPFGGIQHIEERLLQTVGDPFDRFAEDYLRILRGLRFSATLGFSIEQRTADAMLSSWEGLHHVTRERITQEMKKLVLGSFLFLLSDFYLIFEQGIFGLDCLWEADDIHQLREKLQEISLSPPSLTMRLTLFLSLFHPDSALLKLSKEEAREVDFLATQTCLVWEESPPFLEIVQRYGGEKTKSLIFFQKYHYPYHLPQLEALERQLDQLSCTSLKELDLSGKDLMALGIPSGEQIGLLLNKALTLVLHGKVENQKDQILELLFLDL